MKLESQSIKVEEELQQYIGNVLDSSETQHYLYMNIFWQQQQEAWQKNEKEMIYRPMIIPFALSIATKSPSVYHELRCSGVLKLPNKTALTDYKNVVKPKQGVNEQIIKKLRSITESLLCPKILSCHFR